MPGKRITNPSLINTTFPEAVANSAELLTDWNGLVWARPIPISMIGNSWFQGSYDNVTWDNYIKNDHNYLQVSTDGGITWRLIDLTGGDDDHPPVTIGNPWGGLKISGDDTQILTLEYVNYTDPGVMYPYDKWKLDQLRIDWLENLNTDYALYKDYIDNPDGLTRTHRLRTLSASTGISLSYDGDSIAISATPIEGTYSQGRNVATDGIGVFDANNDPYIDFRGLASLSDVLTITLDDVENDIDFDIIEENIDHDILENFVPDEHIDHTTVSILTEEGIKGGGDITTTRTLSLDFPNLTPKTTIDDTDIFALYDTDEHFKINWSDFKIEIKEYTDPFYVPITRGVYTGTGLRGGGQLNVDRTINLAFNDLPTVSFNPSEDYLAIYDGSNSNHAKILLSSVTSVNITEGNGMDFTAITSTGTIDMALPLTVTDSTTNSAGTPGTGHTHTLTIAELISIVDVDNSPVSGEYLKWNGTTWVTDDPSIGATTPGLPLNSLQFNDSNTFGGSAGLLYIEAEDRIYLDAVTSETSGIIFGDNSLQSPQIYGNKGITSSLVIRPGSQVQDYTQILGGRVYIGQTNSSGDVFLDIKDENLSTYQYTLQVGNTFSETTLQLDSLGNLFLPELSSLTSDNILYFDSVTGLVTYGAKPTTNGGGVQTLTADNVSGITVNGGSTSSASTIDLDVNDSRLTPATIDLEDIIGFWDVSASGAYKQRKTTLAEFPGWKLSVNGAASDEIKLGSTLNINAGSNIILSYNDVTNALTINSTGTGPGGDMLDAVLYYPDKYFLYDYDNVGSDDGDGLSPYELISTRRNRARASIGASYVHGNYDEPYMAKELIIGAVGSYGAGKVLNAAGIGLQLANNTITSEYNSIDIVKPKGSDVTNLTDATKVSVQNGIIDFVIDPRDLYANYGEFNFYIYNTSGTKIKVASIKGRYEGSELVADLKVKGDIKFHCTDAEMDS